MGGPGLRGRRRRRTAGRRGHQAGRPRGGGGDRGMAGERRDRTKGLDPVWSRSPQRRDRGGPCRRTDRRSGSHAVCVRRDRGGAAADPRGARRRSAPGLLRARDSAARARRPGRSDWPQAWRGPAAALGRDARGLGSRRAGRAAGRSAGRRARRRPAGAAHRNSAGRGGSQHCRCIHDPALWLNRDMKRPTAAALLAAVLVLAVLAAVAVSASSSKTSGRIGPTNRIQPNGRKLNPVGKLTKLGNFPTNGRLTPDGRFLWTLSAGRGVNDIRIVNVKTRKVVQIIRVPGNSGGLTMTADGKTAYVSGIADSPYTDEKTPDGTPGQAGDVIQVLAVDKTSGKATLKDPIPIPPPSSAAPPQNFPPTGTTKVAWPRDIAVTKDGKKLLVALNLSGSAGGVASAAVIDVASKAVQYVDTGDYPYGAAITSDGKTGLVG